MDDKEKTKAELLVDLVELRQFVGNLEATKTDYKRLNVELEESRTKFRAVFNNSVDAILVSKDEVFVAVNPAFLRMFGYENTNEVIGFPVLNLVAPESREMIAENIRRRAMGLSTPAFYEALAMCKDGTKKWVELSISTYELDKEEYTLAIARDITKRKQVNDALRESEERFHSMFAMHGAIMLLIEPNSGQIIDANLSAQKFYGYSLEKLKNMTIQEINTLPPEKVAAHRQEAVQEKRNYFLFPHRLASGEIRTVEVRSSRISIEGNEFLFSIIHDVTERRLMQKHEREQRALAEALSDSAAALNSTLDFDKVLDRIMDDVWRVVSHDIVILSLLDVDGQIAKVVGCRDSGEQIAEMLGYQFLISETQNMREMLRSGAPEIIADTASYDGWIATPLDAAIRSNLGVPIRSKGKTVGFLSLSSTKPDAFTPLDAERLQAFASHAAIAIENARLYDEVQKLAVTDTLTGIFNRSFFNAELARLESSRDYPVSVIVADLDNMKIINDTLGHAAGDELLKETAKIFQSVFRASDIITRIGGDEFAILLPKTDAKTSEQMLSRIKERLIEYNAVSLETPVQLSLGTATTEKGDLAETFTIADRRMYADKAARKASK